MGLTVVATTYNFANVGGHVKPKGAADLVKGDALLDAQDVGVHGAHVVQVGKDEGLVGRQGASNKTGSVIWLDTHIEPGRSHLFGIKSTGDNVLGILPGQLVDIVNVQWLPQVLFIVRKLDDKRHVECLLQPLRELEGDQVAHVQRR